MRCGRVRVNTFLLPGCGRAPFRFLINAYPPRVFSLFKIVGWRLLASWVGLFTCANLSLLYAFVVSTLLFFSTFGTRCLTEVGNSFRHSRISAYFIDSLAELLSAFRFPINFRPQVNRFLLNILNLFLKRNKKYPWIEFLTSIHWKSKNCKRERERNKNCEGTFYKNRDTSDKRIETYEIFEVFWNFLFHESRKGGSRAKSLLLRYFFARLIVWQNDEYFKKILPFDETLIAVDK